MSTFKAGDRVVATDFGGTLSHYKDETGTVTKFSNGWVHVKWDNPRGDLYEGGWLSSRFTLLPKEEPKPKFKVGDKVRFTDKCPNYWWFGPTKKWKTGVITKVGSQFGIYVDTANTKLNPALVEEEHIELLTEAKPKPSPKVRFIVAVEQNGKLAPNEKPREYYSKRQAESVAKKMAEQHGQTFYVLQAVAAALPPAAPKSELVSL